MADPELPHLVEGRESTAGSQTSLGPAKFLRPRRRPLPSQANVNQGNSGTAVLAAPASSGDLGTSREELSDEEGLVAEKSKAIYEGHYVVERILARKEVANKEYFYIKWEGWPYCHCTWEPEENILHGGEPMRQFKEREEALAVLMKNPAIRTTDNRLHQLRSLDRWERKINGHFPEGRPRVFVYNDVDDTCRPCHFTYIVDAVVPEDIKRPVVKPLKKRCVKQCSCALKNYRDGSPIFSPDRKGFKMAIARTDYCGWGVFALEDIPKAHLVFEFVGEMLPVKQANRRDDMDFQFNLNCCEEPEYVLDAQFMGNESAFMNHSCQANLKAVIVFDEDINPSFHRMALFSRTDILKGEELTLDYYPDEPKNGDLAKIDKTKKCAVTLCRCRKQPCIKYFPLENYYVGSQ